MRTFLVPLVLLYPAVAYAQGPFSLPKRGTPHRTILLGPELTVNRLQSSLAQERFGNPQGQLNGIYPTWQLVKPLVTAETDPTSRGIQTLLDLDLDYRSRGKSSLLTAPVDLGVRQELSWGRNKAFWKAAGSVVLTQLVAEPEGVKRGWRMASGGVVSGGITLGNHFTLEGGVRQLTSVRGFNLSSTFLTASLRFPVGRTR
jgi:hypothetical protein